MDLTQSFIPDGVEDLFVVVGGIGFLLTALGTYWAWRQLRDATSATEAAINALKESQEQYDRFVIGKAGGLLSETRAFVSSQEWSLAYLRLTDLGTLLLQLSAGTEEWSELVRRIHSMAGSFRRVGQGRTTFTASLDGKWTSLDSDLCVRISEQSKPFISTPLGSTHVDDRRQQPDRDSESARGEIESG